MSCILSRQSKEGKANAQAERRDRYASIPKWPTALARKKVAGRWAGAGGKRNAVRIRVVARGLETAHSLWGMEGQKAQLAAPHAQPDVGI